MSGKSRLSRRQGWRGPSIVQRERPIPVPLAPHRRLGMTWETPVAIDYRFGFEINLYIAAR